MLVCQPSFAPYIRMPAPQMKYLDLSLSSPDQNLACDEALLDWQEDKGADEILRVWEPQEYFVVLGYANKARSEARLDRCRQKNVPVFRRCTGGGAVLQGPGCLNYTLILKIPEPNGGIKETNCFVMNRQKEATRIALMSDSMPGRDSVRQPRPCAHSPDVGREAKVEIQG